MQTVEFFLLNEFDKTNFRTTGSTTQNQSVDCRFNFLTHIKLDLSHRKNEIILNIDFYMDGYDLQLFAIIFDAKY